MSSFVVQQQVTSARRLTRREWAGIPELETWAGCKSDRRSESPNTKLRERAANRSLPKGLVRLPAEPDKRSLLPSQDASKAEFCIGCSSNPASQRPAESLTLPLLTVLSDVIIQ